MKRFTHYACDMGGELPGEGRMEEEPDGHYVGYREAAEVIQSAIDALESEHVQRNAFRLGALGMQDLDKRSANPETRAVKPRHSAPRLRGAEVGA